MSAAEWAGWAEPLVTAVERDIAAHAVLEVARGRAIELLVDGKPGQALFEMTRALLAAAEVMRQPVAEVAS